MTKFAESKKKNINDFVFYFEDTPINYENDIKIKDSIFGNKDSKVFNISAILKDNKIENEKEEVKEESNEEKVKDNEEIKEEEKKEEEKEGEKKEEEKKEINEIKDEDQILLKEEENEENNDYYDDITCPECQTSAILGKNKDRHYYNLNILNCDNFHFLKDIPFDYFNESDSDKDKEFPILNDYGLICNICSASKIYMTPPYNKFYKCSCGANVCQDCLIIHDELGHNKIEYKDRNYFCIKHNKKYVEYCFDCNSNLCEDCEIIHEKHEIIHFNKIKPNKNDINNLENEIKKQKDMLDDFIIYFKELFDKMIKKVENYLNSYIKIEKTLIHRFNKNTWNYQLLRNLSNNDLFNNDFFKHIETINNEMKIDEKIYGFLMDIYQPIKLSKTEKYKQNKVIPSVVGNRATMRYRIKENNIFNRKVKLFDPIFVKNNEDKLSIIINDEKQDVLDEYYFNKKDAKVLTVLLQEEGKNPVTDMSYMFNNCKNLVSVDFSNWNTSNITSMEAMFQLCSLEDFNQISNFNTKNLENIRAMFCKCINMKSIPDFTKLFNDKDNKLRNISMLFNGCRNLTSINLPKWYTPILEDMSYLFNRCLNLKEVKNLGKLNTSNVRNMSGLFNKCESLTKINEINGWNTQCLENIDMLFQSCLSLEKICELKWDTKKVKSMNGVFSMCTKLKTIPNIGKWSTEGVRTMIGMFNECINLESIPDLGKWNMNKVINISGIFYKCEKLRTLPKGILNWKFSKNVILDNIFDKSSVDDKHTIIHNWKKNMIQ